MDLAYLIVGIAKNDEKDFRTLFEHTHKEVFALALALVKDRVLAREISIETYRRVRKFASFYDTDINAEFWVLEITKNLCINALNDKSVSRKEGRLDNVSSLLKDLILNTRNDRGAIIILKALSDLAITDIAALLWYYNLSSINEYRRGIREIKKKNPGLARKADINEAIEKDISICMPDIMNDIFTEKDTAVSYISHETMSINENTFTEQDLENEYLRRLSEYGKSTRKARYASLIVIILVSVLLVTFVSITVYRNYKRNQSLKKLYIGNEIAIVELNGVVYYQNYKDDSSLYSYNLSTGVSKKLNDDFVKELITDGEYLFYRNNDDGRIYRVNLDGTNRLKLTEHAGSTIFAYKDRIYYSSPSGINSMKKDGSDNVLLINLEDEDTFSYDILVHNDTVYFSGGAGMGLYYIDSINDEPIIRALTLGEIYNIRAEGSYIYYNTKMVASKKQTTIFGYSFAKEESSPVTEVYSGTGAYDLSDGILYMDGYIKSSSGLKKDQGIYRVDPGSGKSDLIIPHSSTYIYVSEKYIYCYSPDSKGSLVAYNINDVSKKIIIF